MNSCTMKTTFGGILEIMSEKTHEIHDDLGNGQPFYPQDTSLFVISILFWLKDGLMLVGILLKRFS